MRKSSPALLRDVLGVVWVTLMVDTIFLGVGWLLTPHLGTLAMVLFGGLAAATTVLFAVLVGANLVYVAFMGWWERMRRRER